MRIRACVWGENVHEQTDEAVQALYPDGMHTTIANALAQDGDLSVTTATLQEPENGLPEARLGETDVLVWWSHLADDQVSEATVDRVATHVFSGMGLIVLHSGLLSRIFKRIVGAPAGLRWRDAGERERIWVANPRHPIAAGLPEHIDLSTEEMYGEPLIVPEPLETVFISWFEGGDVVRSGLTYRRGAGSVFYFQPGHETAPTFHEPLIGQILRNGVHWAHNQQPRLEMAQRPRNVAQSLEVLRG